MTRSCLSVAVFASGRGSNFQAILDHAEKPHPDFRVVCCVSDRRNAGRAGPSPEEIFREYFARADFPVASGLVYGHFPVKNSLPVGARARLRVTSSEAQLGFVEPVVRFPSAASRT